MLDSFIVTTYLKNNSFVCLLQIIVFFHRLFLVEIHVHPNWQFSHGIQKASPAKTAVIHETFVISKNIDYEASDYEESRRMRNEDD